MICLKFQYNIIVKLSDTLLKVVLFISMLSLIIELMEIVSDLLAMISRDTVSFEDLLPIFSSGKFRNVVEKCSEQCRHVYDFKLAKATTNIHLADCLFHINEDLIISRFRIVNPPSHYFYFTQQPPLKNIGINFKHLMVLSKLLPVNISEKDCDSIEIPIEIVFKFYENKVWVIERFHEILECGIIIETDNIKEGSIYLIGTTPIIFLVVEEYYIRVWICMNGLTEANKELYGKDEFIIGRAKESDICIEDIHASKFHARIFKDDGIWKIQDKSTIKIPKCFHNIESYRERRDSDPYLITKDCLIRVSTYDFKASFAESSNSK